MDYLLLHCPALTLYTMFDRGVMVAIRDPIPLEFLMLLADVPLADDGFFARGVLVVDLTQRGVITRELSPYREAGWYTIDVHLPDGWQVWVRVRLADGRVTRVHDTCAFVRDSHITHVPILLQGEEG